MRSEYTLENPAPWPIPPDREDHELPADHDARLAVAQAEGEYLTGDSEFGEDVLTAYWRPSESCAAESGRGPVFTSDAAETTTPPSQTSDLPPLAGQPFDVDAFNEAAAAFYDFAHQRGVYQGTQTTTHELANRHAGALLEVTALILRAASAIPDPSGDSETRTQLIAIARRALSQTPMVVLAVTKAIGILDRGHDKTQDAATLDRALAAIAEGRSDLEQRPLGG